MDQPMAFYRFLDDWMVNEKLMLLKQCHIPLTANGLNSTHKNGDLEDCLLLCYQHYSDIVI